MQIQYTLPLIEEILAPWQPIIGKDFQGYRNHLYRMIHCCFALRNCSEEEQQKIIIAAAFHDIGIWTDNTVDYIEPSIPPAMAYLQENGLENWQHEIRLMITEHHKIRAYQSEQYPLIELFRRADLVDFSLGCIRQGLRKQDINALKQHFPNAGFHRMLLKRASRWFIKHPLNPAPMMKW